MHKDTYKFKSNINVIDIVLTVWTSYKYSDKYSRKIEFCLAVYHHRKRVSLGPVFLHIRPSMIVKC